MTFMPKIAEEKLNVDGFEGHAITKKNKHAKWRKNIGVLFICYLVRPGCDIQSKFNETQLSCHGPKSCQEENPLSHYKKHPLETIDIHKKSMVTNTGECQYTATRHDQKSNQHQQVQLQWINISTITSLKSSISCQSCKHLYYSSFLPNLISLHLLPRTPTPPSSPLTTTNLYLMKLIKTLMPAHETAKELVQGCFSYWNVIHYQPAMCNWTSQTDDCQVDGHRQDLCVRTV